MTPQPDLAAFLAARLDEDEAIAKAALPGPWMTGKAASHLADEVVYGQSRDWPDHIVQVCNVEYGHNKDADAAHITRHDPARVLREVAFKRAILAECVRALESIPHGHRAVLAERVLRHLAAVDGGHSGYRQEWA